MEAKQKTTVKERPILMSAPMVQAILAGGKTQTRRVMRPQPQPFEAKDEPGEFWHIPFTGWPDGRIRRDHLGAMLESFCPYGKTGDRLWVKETFFCNSFDYPEATDHARENLYYRADGEPDMDGETIVKEGGGWKPSIFMPRWASRLTLEITGVRVELVQDITEQDIFAEGIEESKEYPGLCVECSRPDGLDDLATPRAMFHTLWDGINGKRPGTSWAANPWVWCLLFKRVEEAER